MNFDNLIKIIHDVHVKLRQRAFQQVDLTLTVRNWLIGQHIYEFEQNGSDRAKYGKKLITVMSAELKKLNVKGTSDTNLKLFRQFYMVYPHLLKQPQMSNFLPVSISQTLSDRLDLMGSQIGQTLSDQLKTKQNDRFGDELLLKHFSFSHFIELIKITEPLKRAFYETEAIKGSWTLRILRRQIESLLYERTGLSKNKTALLKRVHNLNDAEVPEEMIRDPYILEFTGLPDRKEYSENDLETALLDHIQEFLIELGNGFCFEARQKRITIDDEHDRIDLVFYHRILKCHVLIDLKVRKFSHADAGQMNFYLNYYRENMMAKGDNPPIGIILCTDRSTTKVKYAITGLDNKLFVSRYKVVLPSEKELEELIKKDIEAYR